MEDDWRNAQDRNTRVAYGEFLACNPDSAHVADAKRRMEDPEYAFLRTCETDTVRTWEGFADSHPATPYSALAVARIQYLEATRRSPPVEGSLVDDHAAT